MEVLILVRHPPVARAWNGRCYGRSDMGLSREGRAMVAPLVARLAGERPDHVVHSGMRRTRHLAELVARRCGAALLEDPRWRERDFGSWEGRTWDAIYRATGNAMDGMVTAPDVYRPGDDGETTAELIARTARARDGLPDRGRTIVVTHGGPIAAMRHLVLGLPIGDMALGIVAPGSFVTLSR